MLARSASATEWRLAAGLSGTRTIAGPPEAADDAAEAEHDQGGRDHRPVEGPPSGREHPEPAPSRWRRRSRMIGARPVPCGPSRLSSAPQARRPGCA